MKTITFRLCALALLAQLTACVNTEKEVGTTNKDPRAGYTPPTTSRARLTGRSVLNTVRAMHSFSDPKHPDTFVLQLRGTRVLTAQAHLIVTNTKGDTLRHEVLPAQALLNDPQAITVRDKEIAILSGMNRFFAADNFRMPAVPTSTEQPAEVDTQTWMALRDDRTAVGFDYPGAGRSENRLAYVHKLGKAVVLSL